ncbi:MerC domain-containing protein [Flagellimonas sp. 389]|uniref:MerC domain-containing protein n=1 Tax=Flagellimonas sp. 389 TaxID=2835862 RepID=UPI001BD454F4|nr:MerC domain-containing protein [Flagellimonas sp. 389]MBS9463945.1 MerC domain-containing protein [Flagellimonas sp. 389]
MNLRYKSDIIGALAGSLCFVHCLATPFFFVAQAGLAIDEASHPWWWGTLDILFLAISFFAVYWSTKNTSKSWIKCVFWSLWILLAVIVLNEKLEIGHLMEEVIYLPTLGLISLHFYNRRYCRCEDDNCCTDQ